MPRSHPPTLITIAQAMLQDELRELRGQRLLVAVSGGADSMALLSVLSRISTRQGLLLAAHGVDHGLRAEARLELDLAERFATELGIPFSRSDLSVQAGSNLQARARAARYAALRARAERIGAAWIATAHHADDRAETLLMRLLRGTSPAALAVIPARSGNLIRPLIRARKRDVLAHLVRHRIAFADDPSNRDLRFLRVRVRQELMPLLEELSPRIVEHLTTLADEIQAPEAGPHAASVGPFLEPEARQALTLLGAAQRGALRRMVEQRSHSARVRVRGGKDLLLDATTGKLVVAQPTRRDRGF